MYGKKKKFFSKQNLFSSAKLVVKFDEKKIKLMVVQLIINASGASLPGIELCH